MTESSIAESPVLTLTDVTCRLGGFVVLQAISLTVKPMERVAIVGPSGAGKSTLIGLMNGSISPNEGKISVLGQSWQTLRGKQRQQQQKQVGTVYQQHQLVDNLRVIHNVNAGHLGRWPLWKALLSLVWPQQVARAKQALAQLGIADKLYARTDRLSGGQQQRVALARMLVQDPAIILADEPVASVDPARSHDIMRLLCEVGQNKTLLISLHDIALAREYCDRIIGLRQGRILFDLPSQSVSDEQLSHLYDLEVSAA